MTGALLLGCNHEDLGEVKIEAISASLAIGISRGRFPKGYAYLDPNEDAVFAATDGTTTVLAVADGHSGFDAARAAIVAIADTAHSLLDRGCEEIVRNLAQSAASAVAATVPSLAPPRRDSRTALTICAVRGGGLAAATLGDTACYVATRRRAHRVGADSSFLASNTDPTTMEVVAEETPLGAVVVSSDGIVDFVPSLDRRLHSAARQQPKDAVESLISAAFAGGAGDNIAVAVFRNPS